MLVLGIETSCDESAVAIYGDEGLLSQKIFTQNSHTKYGGVVPELASRDHLSKLPILIEDIIKQSNIKMADIDAIAYTAGPGLLGSLVVGTMFGKTISSILKVPSLAVNHMEGHLLSPFIEDYKKAQFPILALLVSGGHTLLLEVNGWGEYAVLGESMDDAVGEAFDKTAKLLDLGYPGGHELSKLAQKGNPFRFDLPRPVVKKQPLNFSFSGLKTHVLYEIMRLKKEGIWYEQSRFDMAASFELACVESLLKRCYDAIEKKEKTSNNIYKSLIVSGGVSANMTLRRHLDILSDKKNIDIFIPELSICTDNAAMIAFVGWLRMSAGERTDNQVAPRARWDIGTSTKFAVKP